MSRGESVKMSIYVVPYGRHEWVVAWLSSVERRKFLRDAALISQTDCVAFADDREN